MITKELNHYAEVQFIREQSRTKEIVLVPGKFNILHPGHIRLLKFAKELGGFLVVALESDNADGMLLPGDLRVEALNATHYVDYAFILQSNIKEFIVELKPDIVVKGSEFKTKKNPEKEVIESYGGRLIFGSGDIRFSSLDLLKREFHNLEYSSIEKPIDYIKRHNFSFGDLLAIIDKFSDLNVIVIGDTIVDEYITCDPLGMSQEDPTIVVTPISSDKFVGGAGIVAAHAGGLGAKTCFYSVLGEDKTADFVREKLGDYGVKANLYYDKSRITTLKQRFRGNGKTLLRVNHLRQHYIDDDIQGGIYEDLIKDLRKADLLVFSDFSYGCLPQFLIDRITEFAMKQDIVMVADSQSSSQMGDIARFKNMTLVTPTERELRLAVNDFESGFIVLAEKLKEKSNPANIITTLGAEGIIINKMLDSELKLLTDQLPGMNKMPKDVAGAGDALLIISAMVLAVGADIWQSAYLGSIGAACQVGRLGNMPLQSEEIAREIKT